MNINKPAAAIVPTIALVTACTGGGRAPEGVDPFSKASPETLSALTMKRMNTVLPGTRECRSGMNATDTLIQGLSQKEAQKVHDALSRYYNSLEGFSDNQVAYQSGNNSFSQAADGARRDLRRFSGKVDNKGAAHLVTCNLQASQERLEDMVARKMKDSGYSSDQIAKMISTGDFRPLVRQLEKIEHSFNPFSVNTSEALQDELEELIEDFIRYI